MRTDCEICGSQDLLPFGASKKAIEIVACRACGLVWNRLMRGAEDQLEYYQDDYHSDLAISRGHLDSVLGRAGFVLDFLGSDLKPGLRHLDVGCSEGCLLALTRAKGAVVTGLEFDTHFKKYAVEKRGINVVPGPLTAKTFPSASFDLISFSHVLEHCFHPQEPLQLAHNLLPAGGLLYIEVPNLSRPSTGPFTYFRECHNFYFTQNTLGSLVTQAGFERLRIACSPRDNSLQLLAVKRGGPTSKIPWRDDPHEVIRQFNAHRVNYYLTLGFLRRKIWRQLLKIQARRRYGSLLTPNS